MKVAIVHQIGNVCQIVSYQEMLRRDKRGDAGNFYKVAFGSSRPWIQPIHGSFSEGCWGSHVGDDPRQDFARRHVLREAVRAIEDDCPLVETI